MRTPSNSNKLATVSETAPLEDWLACYGYLVYRNPAWLRNHPALRGADLSRYPVLSKLMQPRPMLEWVPARAVERMAA